MGETNLPKVSYITKVGKKAHIHDCTEKHTKHKNIQQGLLTIYCYNISAYMKGGACESMWILSPTVA